MTAKKLPAKLYQDGGVIKHYLGGITITGVPRWREILGYPAHTRVIVNAKAKTVNVRYEGDKNRPCWKTSDDLTHEVTPSNAPKTKNPFADIEFKRDKTRAAAWVFYVGGKPAGEIVDTTDNGIEFKRHHIRVRMNGEWRDVREFTLPFAWEKENPFWRARFAVYYRGKLAGHLKTRQMAQTILTRAVVGDVVKGNVETLSRAQTKTLLAAERARKRKMADKEIAKLERANPIQLDGIISPVRVLSREEVAKRKRDIERRFGIKPDAPVKPLSEI